MRSFILIAAQEKNKIKNKKNFQHFIIITIYLWRLKYFIKISIKNRKTKLKVKNKKIRTYSVRIFIWYPYGESNPSLNRERVAS